MASSRGPRGSARARPPDFTPSVIVLQGFHAADRQYAHRVRTTWLPTGAELRARGPATGVVVLCVNGGTRRIVPGTWSATIEWLVDRLAPTFPDASFAELRYRVKSWRLLGSCIDDARAALASLDEAARVVMLGFSMGGAVSIGVAGDPRISDIIALAPWIPEPSELAPSGVAGRRIQVIHGDIDGIPGVPGVRASHSRAGAARLQVAGADVRYERIRGGLHGTALRPFGRLVPLPRAAAWEHAVREALVRAGVR